MDQLLWTLLMCDAATAGVTLMCMVLWNVNQQAKLLAQADRMEGLWVQLIGSMHSTNAVSYWCSVHGQNDSSATESNLALHAGCS